MALKQLLSDLTSGDAASSYSNYPTQTEHLEAITFNQRSFKFGEGRAFDQREGGYSREPFIGNPRALLGSKNQSLPEAENSTSQLQNTLGIIDGVTDGLVRGGIVTALQRSATDVTRLTNFYLSERGIGFLLKQTLLQTTNPAIEDGESESFSLSNITGLRRNRQFNLLGTNLLAQSLVNFSGVHFDRAGLLPIWPDKRKYETVVKNKADIDDGHLSVTSKKTNEFKGNRPNSWCSRIQGVPNSDQVDFKIKSDASANVERLKSLPHPTTFGIRQEIFFSSYSLSQAW